ncbi:MAG: hypothetical protein JWL86_5423 [Rhizobium sp.]|nr:hypothetical protein [Rhizobium sp.]
MIAGIVEEGAGGVAGSAGGASSPLVFIGTHSSDLSASSQATVTYTAADIGTPAADRVVFIALAGESASSLGGVYVPTCTIAGVTATVASSRQITRFDLAYIFYAEVPTGASGDIVLTLSGAEWYSIGIGVYTATGLSSSAPHDAQGQTGLAVDPTVNITTTIDIPITNGFALIAGNVGDEVTVTATGFTAVDMNLSQALSTHTIGRKTGAGSHSLTLDWTPSGEHLDCVLAAASWG